MTAWERAGEWRRVVAGNEGCAPAERRTQMTVVWDHVTRDDVLRAIQEYDRLGPKAFFSAHGFGPTTTYDLRVLDGPAPRFR
jgi:hypothetical protein